eukprot:31561-Pelagococcus_subviridis.AAC.4
MDITAAALPLATHIASFRSLKKRARTLSSSSQRINPSASFSFAAIGRVKTRVTNEREVPGAWREGRSSLTVLPAAAAAAAAAAGPVRAVVYRQLPRQRPVRLVARAARHVAQHPRGHPPPKRRALVVEPRRRRRGVCGASGRGRPRVSRASGRAIGG